MLVDETAVAVRAADKEDDVFDFEIEDINQMKG